MLGKNGEPEDMVQVRCSFNSKYKSDAIQKLMITNAQGSIKLGKLADVVGFTAQVV